MPKERKDKKKAQALRHLPLASVIENGQQIPLNKKHSQSSKQKQQKNDDDVEDEESNDIHLISVVNTTGKARDQWMVAGDIEAPLNANANGKNKEPRITHARADKDESDSDESNEDFEVHFTIHILNKIFY